MSTFAAGDGRLGGTGQLRRGPGGVALEMGVSELEDRI